MLQRLNGICRVGGIAWIWTWVCATGVCWAAGIRYVRVDNPTGFVMEWQEVEILVGGKNVILKHPEMFSGTVVEGHDPKKREGVGLTDGQKDTRQRGPDFRATTDQVTNVPGINPWFEIDLGKATEVERVVLCGSRYPERLYMDKGHRLLTGLDENRKVVWTTKWDYYDKARYPNGIFSFDLTNEPTDATPVLGKTVPPQAGSWVPMGWLLNAQEMELAPDAENRLRRFVQRNSPAEIEKLAREFFPLLAEDVPELAEARRLHAAGKHAEALDNWKRYWFGKMRRVNQHTAVADDYFTYGTHAEDLLAGIAVTIGPTSAKATRFTPGAIRWIDIPPKSADRRLLANALTDAEQKAQVGRANRPLLLACQTKFDPRYLQRWSEIMDDWCMNFFVDAAATPYEVEMFFTFNPCVQWHHLMETLSDLAVAHPEMIELLPAATLARVQMICLERYSTGWWRQARETVFNHQTGGIYQWAMVLPYIDEFHPGRRAAREWRQQFERWMTLGTEPDGSMTEIGDEGHMAMSTLLGYTLARLERDKPEWYTAGWRNRAMEWHEGIFKYIFRHLSPGGYDHRFEVRYRPERWTSTTRPYFERHPQKPPMLKRDQEIFAMPEVRRILGAVGHVSSGRPIVTDPALRSAVEAQQQSHDQVVALLGNEKPDKPRINSDWMPYTGAYYFRSGWEDDAAFLAMMACGSHGGSQPTQWPYGMWYHYDYNYPLIRADALRVDGLPPNQLYGRRTYHPGTKTIALTQAEEKPANHRWHSSPRFDFGEAIYEGAFQRLPGFKGEWDYTLEIQPDGKAVTGVHAARQILQLRDSRMFIVTDLVRLPRDTGGHQLSIPYKLSLSTRQKDPAKPVADSQLRIEPNAKIINSNNPEGPSVSLRQFSSSAVRYRQSPPAKVDFKSYAPCLTNNIGIADQEVLAELDAKDACALVSLIASRPRGSEDHIVSAEPISRGADVAGFHAKTHDGREIWYQAAASAEAQRFVCGPVEATARSLLVVTGKAPADPVTGIALSAEALKIGGKPVKVGHADFEFAATDGASFQAAPIYTPIDPVSFSPGRNTFTDTLQVEMRSRTPGVEIRYTTDGTQPGRSSTLYTGPVTISASTEFAARAYRLGPDGKPLDAEGFEINGTRFSLTTYGWFHKEPYQPAADVSTSDLQPGLNYEFLQAPWHRLYASAHWLGAVSSGVVEREMDLSKVQPGGEPYGMRYSGYLKVPEDGVYTFHAPRELVTMDEAASYDLRVYVDGKEWYLTQWWHGHGTWSVPLRKGYHAFQVDYADARTTPWRKSGLWRYYPRSWVIRQGSPSDILLNGPGLDRARIPREWLYRKSK